jgi:hypothetical protein
LIPGFIKDDTFLDITSFINKIHLLISNNNVIPMNIDSIDICYENCRSMYCTCWETPEGGCEPGSEFCRSGLSSCYTSCRRLFD